MELPNLGEHCSLSSCNQLDFLPFTCDACSKIFCKDHVKYDQHQCQVGVLKDHRVPVCPLCNQPISASAKDSVDQKVNDHIENHCKSDLAKHKRSNKCRVKGCKEHILVPVLCASCKQNFCLRHRHEDDHKCVGRPSGPVTRNTGNAGGSLRAGQAAAKRFESPPKPLAKPQNSRPQNSRPQTSVLTAIGSDLDRNRNERLQTPPSRTFAPSSRAMPSASAAQSVQGDLSTDQALALALQASLSESSSGPQNDPPMRTLTQQEREDMELARALQESEKMEREKNRQRNPNQSEDKKDSSCVIS